MDNLKSLGNKIKEKRKQLDLTQEKLAKLVGYTSVSSITKIEKGLVEVPLNKLELFSKVLNIPLHKLLEKPLVISLDFDRETKKKVYRKIKKDEFPIIKELIRERILYYLKFYYEDNLTLKENIIEYKKKIVDELEIILSCIDSDWYFGKLETYIDEYCEIDTKFFEEFINYVYLKIEEDENMLNKVLDYLEIDV